jgi:hypothetical protein
MPTKGPHAAPKSNRQATLRLAATSSRSLAGEASPQPPRSPWTLAKPSDPPLIRFLVKEASRRNHSMQDTAAALGCTVAYLAQLRSGVRKAEHIGSDFVSLASAYLGVPAALVKLTAGSITLQDFLWPQRDPKKDMADCLEVLRDDPVVGSYIPKELDDAAPPVQQFVWRLYTECADRHPTSTRALPRMLEYLQRAAQCETDYEKLFAELRDSMGTPSAQAGEVND